jgi:hypothetical protein
VKSSVPSLGLFLWWLVVVYVGFTLYGEHHPDEIMQISAFSLQKMGILAADDMPWEFHEQIRPWFQPSVYYALLRPLVKVWGYVHLPMERLTLLVQVALVSLTILVYRPILTARDSRTRSVSFYRWGLLSIGCMWFVPSMLVRHSSEAFSTLFLALSLGVWYRLAHSKVTRPTGVGLLAGLLAGLAFLSRFQVGIFVAGFWLTWVAALIRRDTTLNASESFQGGASRPAEWLRRATWTFALGVATSLLVGFLLDWWGYGVPVVSPWRYFHQNIVLDVASEHGRNPWHAYIFWVIAFSVNPLIWFWLVRASWRSWNDPWYRSLSVGLVAFLGVHMMISHKEARFLFPMILPAALLLRRMFERDAYAEFKLRRWLFAPAYMRAVVVLNLAALLVFSLFFNVRDRRRFELALWKLPRDSVVFTHRDVFGFVDDSFDRQFLPRKKAYSTRFRKPTHIRLVYTKRQHLQSACQEEANGFVLLTGEGSSSGNVPSVNQSYETISAFPPSWMDPDWRWWRVVRYKLVRCEHFLSALERRGKPI